MNSRLVTEALQGIDLPKLIVAEKELRNHITALRKEFQGQDSSSVAYQARLKELRATEDNHRSIMGRIAALQRGKQFASVDPSGILNKYFTAKGGPNAELQRLGEAIQPSDVRQRVLELIAALSDYASDMSSLLASQGMRSVSRMSESPEDKAFNSLTNIITRAAANLENGGGVVITVPQQTLEEAQKSEFWGPVSQRLIENVTARGGIKFSTGEADGTDKLLEQARTLESRLNELANNTDAASILELARTNQALTNTRRQIAKR